MYKQTKRLCLWVFVLFVALAVFTSCAGPSSGLSGTTIGALSDSEESLYNSGPVSLPVTIAKLDAFDAEKLAVTYVLGTSTDPNKDGTYTVTGSEGAANMEQAAYALLANGETTVITALNTDGSFSLSISANEGDIVAALPLDSTQTYGGIPLFTTYENGVVTFMFTNSDSINDSHNLVIRNGYFYFSTVSADDGTYSFYRKSLTTSAIDTIVTNFSETIKYVSVDSSSNLNMVAQSGKIYHLQAQEDADGLFSWREPTIVYDYGEELTDDESGGRDSNVKAFNATNSDIFIVNQPIINDVTGSVRDNLIVHVDVSTLTATELVAAEGYSHVVHDLGAEDRLMIGLEPDVNGQPVDFYALNLLDGTAAFDNAEVITDEAPTLRYENILLNLQASVHNIVIKSYGEIEDLGEPGYNRAYEMFSYDSVTNTLDRLSLTSVDDSIDHFGITENSKSDTYKLIARKRDSVDKSISSLIINRFEVDGEGVFYQLTNSTLKSACAGAFQMDDDDRVVFYQRFSDGNGGYTDPQLAFIDVNTLDDEQLVPVE